MGHVLKWDVFGEIDFMSRTVNFINNVTYSSTENLSP